MTEKTVVVRLVALVDAYKQAMGQAAKSTSDVGDAGSKLQDGLLKPLTLATTLAGGFAAKKIFDFGKAGFGELQDAEKVMAQTNAVIKSTGNVANVTSDQMANLAQSLSKVSGVDDEVIQGGANMLRTFTNVRNQVGAGNKIFDQATQAALDLSKAGFGSMESASVMLGKALQDPVLGVTALRRAGVQLSDSQKETIKQLVASGDVLGAQKIILAEVETQVGGSAKAFGDTLPGSIAKAKNSLDEMKGSIVAGGAPALELLATVSQKATDFIGGLPAPIQEAIGGLGLLTAGFLGVARPITETIDLISRFRKTQESTTSAMNSATSVSGLYAKSGVTLGTTLGVIAGAAALAAAAIYGYAQSQMVSVNAAKASASSTEDLVTAFKHLGGLHGTEASLEAFRQLSEGNIGTAQRLRDALAAQGVDVSKLDGMLTSAAGAQRQMSADQAAAAGVTQDQTKTTEALTAALKAQGDAINATLNPMFAVLDATNGVRDAQLKAAEAAATYGAGSAEAAAADVEAAKAAARLMSAEFDLEQGLKNGTITVAGMNQTLAGFVATGALTAEQAARIAARLGDVVAYSGSNVDIYVNLDTAQAIARFNQLTSTLTAETLYITSRLGMSQGGIVHAAGGLIATAGMGTIYNEPTTGGEAYIPRMGISDGRGLALADTAAGWHGGHVVPNGYANAQPAGGGTSVMEIHHHYTIMASGITESGIARAARDGMLQAKKRGMNTKVAIG